VVAPRKPAKAPEEKEHLYILMGVHPLHGKAVPFETYENEEAAWKAAAANNKANSKMAWHVKKIEKR